MDLIHMKATIQLCNSIAILLLLREMTGAIAASKPLLPDSSVRQTSGRMHTLFSVECNNYFDWQTVGLMQSYRTSGQPGPITRLLSCTDDDLKKYRGMDLAPTHVVPSMSRHPKTGDWYPAINKPFGVLHWLENHNDARNVEWVVILDADMIIRHPIVPWELGAERGKPVAAAYGYLIGCDNILAALHTTHPEYCDKVGGLFVMHIDDLREIAPLWLSKTEEVRADREHWATNLTGDIFGQGWISEMYGYSFGAAEVGLRHKITHDLMIYPGYVPREGVEPILMHYGLRFSVGDWSFSKADHYADEIVYTCNKLFPAPPYPKQVLALEQDQNKLRGLLLSIECMNSLNEGLFLHHQAHGCPRPSKSKYTNFLRLWHKTFRNWFNDGFSKIRGGGTDMDGQETAKIIGVSFQRSPDLADEEWILSPENGTENSQVQYPLSKIHTLFSVECSFYFDWQTVAMVHSFGLSGQPGSITRLLSCTEEQLKAYKGLDLAPTHLVPSYSLHPLTNDWYPAINKPAAVLHWLNHVKTDAEFVVILDADMILRGPVTPWEFGAVKGHPVSVPYDYLIGCDNALAKLHTHHPEACDRVGGVFIMHIDDLRLLAPLWLHKTEEVRADRGHWGTNLTGDIYGQGWISEMYGYSFGAAELKLKHKIRSDIMLYPGYVPPENVEPRVLHYGLEFKVGNWRFDKADWHEEDMTNICWKFFPNPPNTASLTSNNAGELKRDTLSVECVQTINNALYLHHKRRGCPNLIREKEMIIDGKATNKAVFPDVEGSLKELHAKGEKADTQSQEKRMHGILEEWNTQSDNESHVERVSQATGRSGIHTKRTTLETRPMHKMLTRSNKDSPAMVISLAYWMIILWTLLAFAFLLVVSSSYSNMGKNRKHLRTKMKTIIQA